MGARGWTVAFVAGAALYGGVLAVAAAVLPARVPLHYGITGEADRWGSRTELVAGLVGVGVVLLLVFAGGAALTRRASLVWVNVPNPGFWKSPEHEAELRGRMVVDLLHVGTVTLVWLAAEVAVAVAAVEAGRDDLPGWSAVLLGAYLVYVLAWCGWLVAGRYRVPPDVSSAGTARR